MAPKATSARVGLIPAQRHAEILEILKADGAASVQQLSASIGASMSTIRRDLEVLEGEGFLERSFGGASLRARALATLETGQAVARHILHQEKQAIARAAVKLISSHQAIILDSGSTVAEIAHCLAENPIPLTVITNDLQVGHTLSDHPRIRIVVTGGTVRPGSSTLLGSPGEELLRSVKADLAFIGAHALTEQGLSETSLDLARIKRSIMNAARCVVIVADHSKFGEPSVFCAGAIPAGAILVTDDRTDPGILDRFRDKGVDVIIVSPDAS